MAIKIRTSNALVEVDTILEFQQVMEIIQGMNGHQPQPSKTEKKPEQHPSLKTFFNKVKSQSPKQVEVLKVLRQRIEGTTDNELRISLGLKSNNELAGVLGILARTARKHGFTYEDIIIREARTDGEKGYTYKLTDAMKEVVPGALM